MYYLKFFLEDLLPDKGDSELPAKASTCLSLKV